MDKWKPYPNDRKILQREDYAVIVPASYSLSNKDKMPLFCPVCKCRFANHDDELSFKKFECCAPCADQWAYSNKDKWSSGWRPPPEQVELFVEKRNFSAQEIRFI